mgnify:CR=1 FL=1
MSSGKKSLKLRKSLELLAAAGLLTVGTLAYLQVEDEPWFDDLKDDIETLKEIGEERLEESRESQAQQTIKEGLNKKSNQSTYGMQQQFTPETDHESIEEHTPTPTPSAWESASKQRGGF